MNGAILPLLYSPSWRAQIHLYCADVITAGQNAMSAGRVLVLVTVSLISDCYSVNCDSTLLSVTLGRTVLLREVIQMLRRLLNDDCDDTRETMCV
jgi:hypothetical protein